MQYIITNENYNEIIPENTTYLIFSNDFNQPFTQQIPKNVTRINFGHNFDQDIILPDTLTHLCFGKKFSENVAVHLLNSLTHLSVTGDPNW